jgi:hypothetical protein
MQIKAPIFEILPANPFSHDLLHRQEIANLLTELLMSTEDPLVLCINASWGQGKTTFIKMWRQDLINKGFHTLYFNAWENDFIDDALVSLIGEFESGLSELKATTKAKKYLEKAKKLGASIIKRTIPAGIKIATAGIVDVDKITEETLSKLTEKLAQEQIEKYTKSKKSISGFREQLSLFAEQIISTIESDCKKPIIIFIDELDRCRPTYAIEVLEKVKHFFNVPHVVFVLAVDKEQLGHSIKSIYGQGMNVDGYLRRFIDLDYTLPLPAKGAFCRAQFDRFGLGEFFKKRNCGETQYDSKQLEGIFSDFFVALNCTLREQEHCFSLLSLAIRATPENNYLYPLLLGTLIVLKIKKPDLYRNFLNGAIGPEEILSFFKSIPLCNELMNNNYGYAIEAHLMTCRSKSFDSNAVISRYMVTVDNPTATETEKHRASRIIELLKSFGFRNNCGILNSLVAKIDMVSKFNSGID